MASTGQSNVRAIKAACGALGYEVTVRHGKGTGWGWLHVTVHNPVGEHDCGRYGDASAIGHGCSQHCPACAKRRVWSEDVAELACEATGRTSDYQRERVIVEANWRDAPAA